MRKELSARELAVLQYAAKGYTDEMIGQELGIKTGTVNSYWVRIRGKQGHLSRTELVAHFVQTSADVRMDLALEDARATHEAANKAAQAEHDSAFKESRDGYIEEARILALQTKRTLDAAHKEIERLRKLLDARRGG